MQTSGAKDFGRSCFPELRKNLNGNKRALSLELPCGAVLTSTHNLCFEQL